MTSRVPARFAEWLAKAGRRRPDRRGSGGEYSRRPGYRKGRGRGCRVRVGAPCRPPEFAGIRSDRDHGAGRPRRRVPEREAEGGKGAGHRLGPPSAAGRDRARFWRAWPSPTSSSAGSGEIRPRHHEGARRYLREFQQAGRLFSPFGRKFPYVIEEAEVNPFVIRGGRLVPLDGLCRFSRHHQPPRPAIYGRIESPAPAGVDRHHRRLRAAEPGPAHPEEHPPGGIPEGACLCRQARAHRDRGLPLRSGDPRPAGDRRPVCPDPRRGAEPGRHRSARDLRQGPLGDHHRGRHGRKAGHGSPGREHPGSSPKGPRNGQGHPGHQRRQLHGHLFGAREIRHDLPAGAQAGQSRKEPIPASFTSARAAPSWPPG